MIQRDKLYHFIIGQAIAGCALLLGLGPWWAVALVALAAVGKEVWDSFGNGTCNVLDAVYTVAGGALVILLFAPA